MVVAGEEFKEKAEAKTGLEENAAVVREHGPVD
jgi:hypothetical protein